MALKRGNGDDPKKKRKSSVKIENNKVGVDQAKVENIFYADIKDPVARKKAAQKYENEAYNKSLKSGYVSLSSLDPTSRKLWSNAIGKSSSIYGDILDYSVSGPAKSYEDIYGKGSKFNPEEFESASKSGNLDKYMSKYPELSQSGIPRAEYGGMRYRTEEDDKKEKEVFKVKLKDELGDPKNVKLNRMTLLKPKITTKKGELAIGSATSEPVEKADWKPAGGVKTKSRIVKPYDVKTGEYIGQNLKYAAQRVAGKNPVLRPGVTKEKLVAKRGDRYLNQGKAYFSNYENQGLASIKEKRAELKASKADLKADIKTARQEGNRERVALGRSLKRDYNAELRQNKLAGKYVKNVGREYVGVAAGQELENTGRVKVNTPKTFAGFLGSNQDTFDKYAKSDKYIRKSTDNAVNRNSTESKIKLSNRKNR
jgi:hypothetical protein